ncbi:MAG: sigma-70 family RNA polymerase sigma factor [Jatrophihabitantaceae bacterium]
MDLDQAMTDLLENSGDRLLRLAYQLSHDRSSAEDLVQEALTQVYRSWRRRAPEIAHAEAYVRRAIVNEYLRRRRLRSASEVITDELPEPPIPGNFDDELAERERVWHALAMLPPRQRTVLVLRYYEALPDHEIAALIGAKETTVRSLAARALAALRSGELAFVPVQDGRS